MPWWESSKCMGFIGISRVIFILWRGLLRILKRKNPMSCIERFMVMRVCISDRLRCSSVKLITKNIRMLSNNGGLNFKVFLVLLNKKFEGGGFSPYAFWKMSVCFSKLVRMFLLKGIYLSLKRYILFYKRERDACFLLGDGYFLFILLLLDFQ